MKTLLTIPHTLISFFNNLFPQNLFYASSDPIEGKVGSGGGTANLLVNCFRNDVEKSNNSDFGLWLNKEKRVIIHAGGQSRRLPAYASVGKVLTPIPVFKWERGQKIDQTLFDLQTPLFEEILSKSPVGSNTLIASGDVLIRAGEQIPTLPTADVICFGQWLHPEQAQHHGVFFCKRSNPQQLEFMLQKPSPERIQHLASDYLFLLDIGIWLLSEKAVKLLCAKSGWDDTSQQFKNGKVTYYDLYSEFGPALGIKPTEIDEETNKLTVAIIPMPKGSFYHFGKNSDLLESSSRLQNLVTDQREIWHRKVKPHPDIFTQNALTDISFSAENYSVWIENSCIGKGWTINHHHILTGIPKNNWTLNLPAGICLDMIPIGNTAWCIRPYGFYDTFNGEIGDQKTFWMGKPIKENEYIKELLASNHLNETTDIQFAPIFPVVDQIDLEKADIIESLLRCDASEFETLYHPSTRLSAAEIQEQVNFGRLYAQRDLFCNKNLITISRNYKQSIFYQLDLNDTAQHFAKAALELPPVLPIDAPLITRMHDSMFRAKVAGLEGLDGTKHEAVAFSLLSESIVAEARSAKVHPELNVMTDQIVWGRSPIRLDLAGGWSDTPPYCLLHGGKVINMAVELNGQPPLQVFIKPSESFTITLRSIDLGVREDVNSFEELSDYNTVGSAFSISKTALCLAGFHPEFCTGKYNSLTEQLKAFGSGIEISLLAAIPKGSGLGTSSILASTVLGALSDFCSLGWDKHEICFRTLVLEQLLTTGGGWQDQYGGVFNGIKLLETEAGLIQKPIIRWTPEHLFTQPEYSSSILLYYTGITRIAKNILAEIVRGMFLNSSSHLSIIKEIKHHALTTYDAVQQGNWEQLAAAINYSWHLNQRLDVGTNPPEIEALLHSINDYLAGCKLLGAGGGGYMLLFAKNPEAAARIRHQLTIAPPNKRARFVEWGISSRGFQITRS
ncbi:MAG: bifunctional fucokinase/L-fucose-1-P-guanylyltransferase [Bacteroidetes bacterium]|nr:bifunctional fucokinase/L-fucose-1-P-guanylyltransferase [Bacteroidota bacterium]